ncbi:unnamed protein product, partial [Amoebophrya sp. A120]
MRKSISHTSSGAALSKKKKTKEDVVENEATMMEGHQQQAEATTGADKLVPAGPGANLKKYTGTTPDASPVSDAASSEFEVVGASGAYHDHEYNQQKRGYSLRDSGALLSSSPGGEDPGRAAASTSSRDDGTTTSKTPKKEQEHKQSSSYLPIRKGTSSTRELSINALNLQFAQHPRERQVDSLAQQKAGRVVGEFNAAERNQVHYSLGGGVGNRNSYNPTGLGGRERDFSWLYEVERRRAEKRAKGELPGREVKPFAAHDDAGAPVQSQPQEVPFSSGRAGDHASSRSPSVQRVQFPTTAEKAAKKMTLEERAHAQKSWNVRHKVGVLDGAASRTASSAAGTDTSPPEDAVVLGAA